ncbi:MAG: hypothetical protein PHX83_01620 [Acidobacteriia bacterium]|nr:hypothetical protein [Terriglobia bacterium]
MNHRLDLGATLEIDLLPEASVEHPIEAAFEGRESEIERQD